METIRRPAEHRHAAELAALEACDSFPRPPGWRLSPRMVETFLLGAEKPVSIAPKYVGDRALIQVAIATLASDRALLLIGEPGTAKSWLSEHLAAAISGSSELMIQGTAGTTEEQIKYSWNYALLLSQGPSESALVKSPLYRGMEGGRVVRLEEITRIAPEVQDSLISTLSEKSIAVPELGKTAYAARGFNVIGTANTRDRGVNEMSSALKRRFNFVALPVLADPETEMRIVARRVQELQNEFDVKCEVPRDVVRLVTTVFEELRQGRTLDGKATVKSPSAALSTAELISVLFNGAILSSQFGGGRLTAEESARSMIGAISQENPEDLRALAEYVECGGAGRQDGTWKEFHAAVRRHLGE